MSPVGTAILWAMQCPAEEDYRMAALAAWECLSPPMEVNFNSFSDRSQSHQFKQRLRSSRITGGYLGGGGDQGPIQAEVRRMNLADDNATVRRMALRILMSRQKCRSIACSLDTSRWSVAGVRVREGREQEDRRENLDKIHTFIQPSLFYTTFWPLQKNCLVGIFLITYKSNVLLWSLAWGGKVSRAYHLSHPAPNSNLS